MRESAIKTEGPSKEWRDYELIDSGEGRKLERFGDFVLSRPEPKALWNKTLSEKEWREMADVTFIAGAGFSDAGKEEKGRWQKSDSSKMPDRWQIEYLGADYLAAAWNAARHGVPPSAKGLRFKLRLGLTAFKHVGVFPEQAPNWEWIYDTTKGISRKSNGEQIRVLNLFAYTGAASLAARLGGAMVTHVDSVKQVVTWAKENLSLSGGGDIRWIVDDAIKFVKREVRRGNVYNGLILDPPAYGHGPDGERWKLDEHLFDLLCECSKLVAPHNSFTLLNLYSNGYSAPLAETLLRESFRREGADFTCGELHLVDRFNKVLPLSVYARMCVD